MKVLTIYREINTAAAAVKMILMTNMTVATALMRNIRKVLMREA